MRDCFVIPAFSAVMPLFLFLSSPRRRGSMPVNGGCQLQGYPWIPAFVGITMKSLGTTMEKTHAS